MKRPTEASGHAYKRLGELYRAQGRHAEAEPLYKRVLAGRETVLGAEHPDTLSSVTNVGALYHAQGRYGEAEPLLNRAFAGIEKVLDWRRHIVTNSRSRY